MVGTKKIKENNKKEQKEKEHKNIRYKIGSKMPIQKIEGAKYNSSQTSYTKE